MTIIGSVGVTMLLVAFLANLFGWLESRSKLYQGLNAVGAGLRSKNVMSEDKTPIPTEDERPTALTPGGCECLAGRLLRGRRSRDRDGARSKSCAGRTRR